MKPACGSGPNSPPSSLRKHSSTPTALWSHRCRVQEGIDIDHDGDWGYQPLISLANTAEPLYLSIARATARPMSSGRLPRQGDRLVSAGRLSPDPPAGRHRLQPDPASGPLGSTGDICFIFRIDARIISRRWPRLAAPAYSALIRPPKYAIKTEPRQRPERVKEGSFASGDLRRSACSRRRSPSSISPGRLQESYRLVVLRKHVGIDKGRCGS